MLLHSTDPLACRAPSIHEIVPTYVLQVRHSPFSSIDIFFSNESIKRLKNFFLIQLGAAIKIHFFCWLFLAFFSYAFYSIFTYICSVLFDMISLSLDTSLEDFNQFFSFSFFLFFLYIFFPLTPCRVSQASE